MRAYHVKFGKHSRALYAANDGTKLDRTGGPAAGSVQSSKPDKPIADLGAQALQGAIRAIVQCRTQRASIKGDLDGRSMRFKFMTEAGRQCVPLPDVMAMTGHTSFPRSYYRRDRRVRTARSAAIKSATCPSEIFPMADCKRSIRRSDGGMRA